MKNKNKVIIYIVGIVVVVFGLIQLIPYGHNHNNPSVVSEPKWDSPLTRELAKRACFDCHSNEPIWPWYSNVAPASWLVQHDVDEGRRNMNFSDWDNYSLGINLIEPSIMRGKMPPSQYLIIHSDANLSAAEKEQFINGLKATLSQ